MKIHNNDWNHRESNKDAVQTRGDVEDVGAIPSISIGKTGKGRLSFLLVVKVLGILMLQSNDMLPTGDHPWGDHGSGFRLRPAGQRVFLWQAPKILQYNSQLLQVMTHSMAHVDVCAGMVIVTNRDHEHSECQNHEMFLQDGKTSHEWGDVYPFIQATCHHDHNKHHNHCQHQHQHQHQHDYFDRDDLDYWQLEDSLLESCCLAKFQVNLFIINAYR